MKTRRIIAGILSGLVLTALLAGCGAKENETVQPPSTEAAPEVQTEVQQPVQTEDVPYVTVSTPYGDLYFQDQWEDLMKIEQKETDDSVEVAFSAEINDMTYTLFYVTIGSGGGTPVGELTGPDGVKREVFVRSNEMEDIPELSDGERNRLYAMQEDINYIIENLK